MTTPRDLSQVGPPTPSAGEARRGRAPPASWMDQLERSLRTLAARGGPRSLAVARTMCANVAANPEEARYRLIRLDNQSFHRRVWDVEGGRDVCHALGWHHVPADADGQGAVVVLPKECATTTTLPAPSPRSLGSSESPAPTTTATADFSLVETKRQPKTFF